MALCSSFKEWCTLAGTADGWTAALWCSRYHTARITKPAHVTLTPTAPKKTPTAASCHASIMGDISDRLTTHSLPYAGNRITALIAKAVTIDATMPTCATRTGEIAPSRTAGCSAYTIKPHTHAVITSTCAEMTIINSATIVTTAQSPVLS